MTSEPKFVLQLITSQEINIQNMNVELVAQMFKNYQSNVLFHLEGMCVSKHLHCPALTVMIATDNMKNPA